MDSFHSDGVRWKNKSTFHRSRGRRCRNQLQSVAIVHQKGLPILGHQSWL